MIVFSMDDVELDSVMETILDLYLGDGELQSERVDDNQYMVFENKDFVVLYVEPLEIDGNDENGRLEIYGKKNTNSIKYYEIRFPVLCSKTEHLVVRTKRWSK